MSYSTLAPSGQIQYGCSNYSVEDSGFENTDKYSVWKNCPSNVSLVFNNIIDSFSSVINPKNKLAGLSGEIEMQVFSRKRKVEQDESFSCENEMQVFSSSTYTSLEIEPNKETESTISANSYLKNCDFKIIKCCSDVFARISESFSFLKCELMYIIKGLEKSFYTYDQGGIKGNKFETNHFDEGALYLEKYQTISEIILNSETYALGEELRDFDVLSYLTPYEKNKALLEELKGIKIGFGHFHEKLKLILISSLSYSLNKIYEHYKLCLDTPSFERSFEEMSYLRSDVACQNFKWCDHLLSEYEYLHLQPFEIIQKVISRMLKDETSEITQNADEQLQMIQGYESYENVCHNAEL